MGQLESHVSWDSHTNGSDNDYIIGMEMETKSWELEGTDIRQLFPHISSAVMFRSGISGCNTWLCCNDQSRHLFSTLFFWKNVKHNAAFHSKSRSANIWPDSMRFTLPVWEWTEASKTGLRTKAIKESMKNVLEQPTEERTWLWWLLFNCALSDCHEVDDQWADFTQSGRWPVTLPPCTLSRTCCVSHPYALCASLCT